MATFSNIGLEEPSTITKSLAAVTVTRNSSATEQELITLADPESSLGLLRITDTTPDSTMFGVVVRQVGYTAPSTTVSVSTGSVRVHQSTAADLNVTVAGYSTVVSVSTGSIRVHQSTATDLLARVNQGAGNSSAADRWRVNVANSSASDYLPVRIVDSSGTGFLTPGNEYTAGSTYSSFAGPTIAYNNSSNDTYRTVGVATPLPAQLLSSSGGNPYDSTNRAYNVNVVAGAASGSTIATISRFLSTSGDPVTVGDTANAAIRVNVVAGAAGGSTIVTVSTGSVRVHQSSAADLTATVTFASTGNTVQARVTTSSGGAVNGSTSYHSSNHTFMGLNVRPLMPVMNSVSTTVTSTASSHFYELISSGALLQKRVYAYSVTSTAASPLALEFVSGTNTVVWSLDVGSGSSGVTGANLAVPPPGALFQTAFSGNLNLRLASTGVGVRVSLAYYETD